MSFIEIKDLNFKYKKDRQVIKNLNLTIEKGEWVTILGHNGSGKSTLAKLIIGLLRPTSGEIIVDGITLSEETVYDIRKKIGIVFQNPDNQFVGVTVRDDIAFGMENLCFEKEVMINNVMKYAEIVEMDQFLDKQPHHLSGGQKQRVAIAGILAMNPDIIIFDEATSMLDPESRNELYSFIRKVHKSGVSIITITHDMTETLYSDRIVVLKNGEIIGDDTVNNIIQNEELLIESKLELLPSMELLIKLQKAGYDNKEVEDLLWELSLKK